MKIIAVALSGAVIYAGAAAAAPCNTTALSQILMSGNVSTCQAESGYNITSLTMPTNSQVNRVCSSSACMDSIDAVKQVAPDECTIGPVQLYANVINPVLQRCGVSTGSTAGSGSVSGAGSGSGPAAGDVGYGSHAGNAGSVASGSMSGSRPMMKPPGTNTSQPNAPPSSPRPAPSPAHRSGGADAPTLSMCAAIAVLAAAVAIIL
ncbi:hypothetical protein PsorP6_005888 [Peronosclerospora sorghi]|uniref:Uncharacterized protein n=1 Tax=Peronosclerospora sorghi TaxID=230839 RepID=A0ACC0W3Z5_9STRA|nr:hypothetical protein PsorP6_005888 [Peronosclerospora sorghi]